MAIYIQEKNWHKKEGKQLSMNRQAHISVNGFNSEKRDVH